ncbi:autotransporter outer membrane beta-barrel domain-containing protein [Rhizobium acidisoli]|uniref:autotransporter outer membrane beta-barrel domain-containing protein n=1 Tax=Rhizobium acidisoli TaxID=1538158 RepID=UPI0006BA154F
MAESAAGALIGGFSVHFGTVSADASSLFGTGDIDSTGDGPGGTPTWYGNSGLYIDAQGQLTWYDSDLHSDDLSRTLTRATTVSATH